MRSLPIYILIFCYSTIDCSCHPKLAAQRSNTSQFQSTDKQGHPELLGTWAPEQLEQPPYGNWYLKNYAAYQVDSATADQLKSRLEGKQLLIFMGTWCGDSQREVPRMMKILRYCGVPAASITMVTVSDADSAIKQSPGHEEKGRDIFRVPDLIVLDHGKEQGRIIESPVNSLEKDLLSLTKEEAYRPHYAGAATLAKKFHQLGASQVKKNLPSIAEELRPLMSSQNELRGYARVLKAAGEAKKSAIALQINDLLFPPGK